MACPGYPDKFRFCNVSPTDIQKPYRRKYLVSYRQDEPTKSLLPTSSARPQPPVSSMDNRVAPNLSAQASHNQHRVNFSWAIDENFTGYLASYSPQVDVHFIDFALHPEYKDISESSPLLWATRCASAIHLGQTRNCPSAIVKSRQVYQQALACLRQTLGKRSTLSVSLSHNIACTMLLLIFYELKDGVSKTSWLVHTEAVAGIFRLNGPDTYRSGVGRTLFTAARPFLVGGALLRGEPCLLEREEWRSLAETVTPSNGSRITDVSESAYREIIGLPGLVASARKGNSPNFELIIQTQKRLNYIKADHLEAIAALHNHNTETDQLNQLLGPIPFAPAEYMAQLSLVGVESALNTLDCLLHGDLNGIVMPVSSSSSQHPLDKPLDRFCLSMGLV